MANCLPHFDLDSMAGEKCKDCLGQWRTIDSIWDLIFSIPLFQLQQPQLSRILLSM